MKSLADLGAIHLFAVQHGDFLRWSFFFLLLALVVIVAGAVILYHKLRKAGFRKASIALLGIGVCVAVGAVKPGTNGVNHASVRGVRAVDSLETSGDGESAPQGFRPTRFSVATNRLEVSVAWDEDDEIGLIAYRTARSLSPPVWSPYSCVTEFLDSTGHLWTVDAPSSNSSFFVDVSGHSLDGDADEDGVSNGRELSLGTDPFSAHSDADWLTDGQELGVASVCRPSGFLWFEISSEGRNELWQSAADWDTWVELDGGLRI